MADGTLFGQLSERRRVYSAGLVIDLYAGGGGASEGIRAALGRDIRRMNGLGALAALSAG